jgi:hypothetical protein
VVLYLAMAGFATINSHIRCLDAAREAARLVARGEPGTAQDAVTKIAPQGAQLTVATNGDRIEVQVSLDPLLPGLDITGKAFAVAEPQGDPP